MIRLQLLSAATLLACVACGPAVREPGPSVDTRVTGDGVTRLPLLDGDQPVVQVEIRGHGTAHFLVDTGAEYSWISDAFATATGMLREPLGATLTDINNVKSAVAERALLDRLEIGGIAVTDARPPIFPSIWEGIDGSLGQDWLRGLLVIVDGPGRELILAARDSKLETLGVLYETGGSVTAYEVQWGDGIPKVVMPVAGLAEPLTFWIDTGVGCMSLTREAVDELGLPSLSTTELRGLGGSVATVPVYDIDDLKIGKLDYTDEAILLEHATLGWGVLRHKVLVFDNADDTLWLGDFERLDSRLDSRQEPLDD